MTARQEAPPPPKPIKVMAVKDGVTPKPTTAVKPKPPPAPPPKRK